LALFFDRILDIVVASLLGPPNTTGTESCSFYFGINKETKLSDA
jgi:hypothetical protein